MRAAAYIYIYVYVYRRWVHGTRGAGAEGRGTTRGMGRGGGGGATAEYAGGYLCQFDYRTGLFVLNTVLEKQIKAVIYFWGEPKEALSWS